jgi:hypothetical protein
MAGLQTERGNSVNVGDRIILEDISGEVVCSDEETYAVKWGNHDYAMNYDRSVKWEDADDFVRIDVGTYLDDLYEKNKDNVPWKDAE